MRSRKLPVAVLVVLWTVACNRSESPGTSPPKKVPAQAAATGEAAGPPTEARRRRRLPPPLRPNAYQGLQPQDTDIRPCTELVNKVCALLSEGAEECGEARSRIERRPGTVRDDQCERALSWYFKHVEQAKRVLPCALLAEAKCAANGPKSNSCVNARADVAHLKGELGRACLAELLLFKGFP